MKKIRTLLIDDEISALKTIRGMLQNYFPQIEIVGTAQSVNEGFLKVKEHRPELVFLDVEMPPFGSGFDFLEKCKDYHFGVIFTTAYPKYAVDAINAVQPWAYLVKPFSISQLKSAIATAEEKIAIGEPSQIENLKIKSIILPDARKGDVIINVNDILYCKADGSTTEIYYLIEKKVKLFVASRTLKEIENELNTLSFFRCHHSYIVNFIHVSHFKKTGRNGVILLKNKMEIPVAVSRLEEFKVEYYQFIRGNVP